MQNIHVCLHEMVIMALCAAPNCDVRTGMGVRLYFFPVDYNLCKVWVERLKKRNFWPSRYSKLCERHFTRDSFMMDPDAAKSVGYTRIMLEKDAVPSIFDYTPLKSRKEGNQTSENKRPEPEPPEKKTRYKTPLKTRVLQEPSSPKKSRESLQVASAWQIDNLKSADSDQINPNSDPPDTTCPNGNDSVIVIQDDSSLHGSSQAESNVITVSDSESDCLSLPDIDDPFDSHPCLSQSPAYPSAIIPSGLSPHPETKEQNVIYISEDSIDLTVSDDDIEDTLINFEETLNEEPCIDLIDSSIESSHCKKPDTVLDDSGNNFNKDTSQYICTNKDNDRGCTICTSALNSKPCTVNNSLPVSTFVLPYSLQPYANDTDLGVGDLKDQPQVTVELIQACLEEGTQFALCSANISCQYLYAYRPTQRSLENLLKWLQQRDVGFKLENEDLLQLPYFKLYGLLNELFHCYPENVIILWNAVCERMLTIPLDKNVFLDFAITLEISLSVLEGEFFRLQDPKKCQIYRLLANNETYSNTKKIIQCLNQVVMILVDKNLTIAEQVLCQLEKLLELSVVISLSNGTMAKRIAKDLVGVYLSIPFLDFRQRFLSTIQSDLIRFKLLEIVLEKYCGETMLSWSYMPESIADIAKSFFLATPMKNNLLDDCIVIDLDGLPSMSPSRIEELIMMIYFAIISYIACLQGSFYHSSDPPGADVSCSIEPVCNGSIPPPWNKQLSQLKDLPRYISQLNRHVRNFNVELSQGSLLYLMMLDHLTDLMDDDVALSVF